MPGLSWKVILAGAAIFGFGVASGFFIFRSLAEDDRRIRVTVLGEVERPGTYFLVSGALMKDLVQKAGGFTVYANLSQVNLGESLDDGATIVIPGREEDPGTSAAAKGGETGVMEDSDANRASGEPTGRTDPGSAGTGTPALVNINKATAAELETLPGIGPKLAAEIIKYRETYGPFKNKDDIKKVKGIGDAKYAKIADSITV
jgi:competence protein ComEA